MVFNLGLIGYPLTHSLSPNIHKAALESCGLEGEYSLFPIYPGDQEGLEGLLDGVRRGEIHGLNVTIPHKQNVIPLLDELTLTAKVIGAVNTIFLKEDKLTGDNTDGLGFVADLYRFLTMETRRHKDKDKKYALVLGAGGAARAVAHALVNDGWKVTIASRRSKQAHAIIAQFPVRDSRLSSIDYHPTALYSLISNLSLLINTTPLGMSPDIESSPWPDSLPFPPNAAVYDLVYNPRETKLVRDARAAGLPATTGLGMLIEQAALSFEIWTGCLPQFNALFKAVD